jgi:hypothetical protein
MIDAELFADGGQAAAIPRYEYFPNLDDAGGRILFSEGRRRSSSVTLQEGRSKCVDLLSRRHP